MRGIAAAHGTPCADAGTLQCWRDIGLLQFVCDVEGELREVTPRGRDWLADLVCHATICRRAIAEASRRWAGHDEPPALEVLPGLWLVAIPLTIRRAVAGYSVVALPAATLLDSGHLDEMCAGAGLDPALVRDRLRALPPVAVADVDRLAALARLTHREQRAIESSSSVIESVSQELAGSYEDISFLYTISRNMSVAERPETFIALVCDEMVATIPYAWVAVVLADDRSRLKQLAGRFVLRGQTPIPPGEIQALSAALLASGPGPETMVVEAGASPLYERLRVFGRTSIVQPMVSDDVAIGLLIAGDKQGADGVASSVDIKLLEATAEYASIFLENATLYDDLNAMFLGTLEALTASIDAKDRYTCGHSERVAHLTLQLARAAGLDEETISRTHIAGLVHDVGKIGVPEQVLLKPGKLTSEEFDWIRRHPEIGYRILKDIPQFEDILPGVLYHHERWDGGGYPEGVAGESIPLLGRLIALADAFDAMSSTRTYRAEMDRADVLAEITRCAGTQFDPRLAAIFVDLDFTEFDRLFVRHRARSVEREL